MTTRKCTHSRTLITSTVPFAYSVAVAPYTDENPAAWGWQCSTEQCQECGRERSVNVNQSLGVHPTRRLPLGEQSRTLTRCSRRFHEISPLTQGEDR